MVRPLPQKPTGNHPIICREWQARSFGTDKHTTKKLYLFLRIAEIMYNIISSEKCSNIKFAVLVMSNLCLRTAKCSSRGLPGHRKGNYSFSCCH